MTTDEQSTTLGPKIDELFSMAAALLDATERDDRFASLLALLRACCPFDNFLAYQFSDTSLPLLLGTTVPENRLTSQMADFVSGLFLLDPFFLAQQRGASGLICLRDISPEGFLESEYYQHHYRYTDVCDELRFLVPIGPERTVHFFVERETPSKPFSPTETVRLRAAAPLVDSFARGHFRWRDRLQRHGDNAGAAASLDLQALIGRMGSGILTTREREVVERMLKGHSARSIAMLLAIEEGTVTNHKRNIYAKLEVHSMAQLFNLFLSNLEAA